MRFWFVLQQLALIIIIIASTTDALNNNETDHVSLLAMKSKILDPFGGGVLSSWNESSHFCNWEGVFCGKRHKRVTLIALSSLGLSGTLSPHVGNLTFLRRLWLDNNTFHGEIPNEIGGLYRLKVLVLRRNSFQGRIPASLSRCSNLMHLIIGYNNLVGTIPEEFSSLSMLKTIAVHHNNLTGGIPKCLGNITSLETLSTASNLFGGTIPNNLGKLKNLVFLGLGGNQISGMIPSSLYNLSNLNDLYLSFNDLHGSLPPYFGNMFPHLESLQLEFNNFTGQLPNSIGNLTKVGSLTFSKNEFSGKLTVDFSKLVNLVNFTIQDNNFLGKTFLINFNLSFNDFNFNLSFNDFNGELPLHGSFANSTAVSVYGNDKLCGGIPSLQLPRCPVKKLNRNFFFSSKRIYAIVGASILGILILISSLGFYLGKRKRESTTLELFPKESFVQVSYGELLNATDGFSSSNLIGAGSFGFVYRGVLDQFEDVAIKVFNLLNPGATRSFVAECKALKNIRHRNLVKIVTCCSSIDFQGNEFKALVYKLMMNGNLEKWLHPSQEFNRSEFNLFQRLRVAIDVASALDYLHYQCEPTVIHCDLKPSNILLDQQMVAHVGDFGLARLFHPEMGISHHSSSMGLMGTIGYAAPEYGLGSEMSISGDVYSYGILLLEMLTGKRPTDLMFVDGLNLRNFAGKVLKGNAVEIVMDPVILKSDIVIGQRDNCLIAMVKIGLACSKELPQNRMSMTDVSRELQLIKDVMFK
ncbi:putative receptor-like protein kinase At3g47110 [Impatiens glandulifera]|uniref:putative receptor-like protein kinase At3g47110 n=1 Tax=Impatiens glandulifera TaxID=253017 RepID=UPI001FB0B3E7|nr:putative receptor-like protein kinase At3g47110 [Impatiens glandulifera]